LLPQACFSRPRELSRMKRTAKEKAIKKVREGCLSERGYQVSG
jgi:hypothetical protein